MVSRVIPVQPFDLVLFGATGDLARRKILPGLYHRFTVGQMPPEARIIGSARSKMDAAGFREKVRAALEEFTPAADRNEEQVDGFLDRLDYVSVDASGKGGWKELAAALRPDVVRAFYLSVSPSLFSGIAARLHDSGLATADSRIVVEKPFGHDLNSAQELNAGLRANFEEHQIYRIDHYLGKETVQNLMALRFANSLFEPLWNATHIDHVQITVAETIGVDGRGAYYDGSGAMRDMIQNHLVQLLCLTAMESPSKFTPNAVRDEKVKVIQALDPVEPSDIVRGQYRADDGGDGYCDHVGNPDSRTESFVAMKVHVSNWRWAGTPFYLRTGKKLRARESEIAVVFRDPPHTIFPNVGRLRGNVLVIRLQPDEGITLRTTIKDPGPGGLRLTEVSLDMSFAEALGADSRPQDAYERLVMDVIRGDQTLFMRGDEVEAAWAWVDPVIQSWADSGDRPAKYDAGSSGPEDALMLMHRDGRRWREIGG
ncbi:glucose-6-phosphate 1-dehydrogenase [Cribrihabitans marinus]|uniref:Glucose-6-phosphate 1-dehydrogenase n=1 Tax=Cribrihabitans marinus TaxID=1227549 RepID=A0A1H7AR11_9RHOB|nr:glucose-6-phosphate dehydrogenase [Cribrihabitans marinus]GGH32317.1 glucose-6-phosphate 1-dehydrogenase [Cribrihabitans marinus]SEJ67748.1 glucose-6-phosphate 1-dehydrogenase [Cribrihabitans marinus]